ncbi:proton-coupled amino acid transporter-like protein pathetic [Frankliniella occidentalis]|uniref:Proton-coupled amino acid transporter-like protein pathetic n=1 Tax=Frankliniella occidentalis TaxID=133901 RepID=A0A9C6X8G8_FRAOC|nr:proton-coupled amino acid transporter-like protein pathetic [Frankliniella occidentalis]
MKKKVHDGKDGFEPSATLEIPPLQSSKINLVYPAPEDELYDPFSQRPQTLQYSDFGAWAHMVKGGMGTGIMAMPMAFKYGGFVLGLIGTPVVGLVAVHCVCLLVATAQHLYVRARVPSMTMPEVAYYSFKCGPSYLRRYAVYARIFVQLVLFLTYFFTIISYSIFIGAALQQLVEQWTGDSVLDGRVYIAILALPLIPLGQVRQMRQLVPCSVLANACIVVGFAITLYYLLDEQPGLSRVSMAPTLIGVPIFFSTAIYSMEGIGTVMPVENTMRNPGRLGGWNGIASRAMAFVVAIFTTIGALGYLKFGEAVLGSITLNLDSDLIPAQVVKALLAAAITLTHPLQFYVVFELVVPIIESRVSTPSLRNWAQIGMRMTLVTLSLLVAIAVPNLELVIALMGAVLFSSLGLLIPAGVHLVSELARWEDDKLEQPGRAVPARRVLTVAKDGLLLLLSLLTTCAGVYSALDNESKSESSSTQ